MADDIQRTGLGVEIPGGEAAISTLKAVRSEMQGILALSRQIEGNVGGASPLQNQFQTAFKRGADDHIRAFNAMEKDKTRIHEREIKERERLDRESQARQNRNRPTGSIGDDEVRYEADKQRRIAEVRRRARELNRQQDEAAEIEADKARMRRREIAERWAEQRQEAFDRKLAQGRVTDPTRLLPEAPSNAPITPYPLGASPIERDITRRREYAQRLANDRQNEFNRVLTQGRINDPTRLLGTGTPQLGPSSLLQRGQVGGGLAGIGGSSDWRELMRRSYDEEVRAAFLGTKIADQRKKTIKDINDLDQQTVREMLRGGATKGAGSVGRGGQLQFDSSLFGIGGGGGPGGPSGPGGGGGGRGPRNNAEIQARLRDPQGLFNEKGFFTSAQAIGRITRNIILYEVISRATYGLTGYVAEAIQAAKATDDFYNAMRFATEQAGGNVAANERLAESLRDIGISRKEGLKAVTEAARFADFAGQNAADIPTLTRTVSNIAAVRGLGIDNTDELIERLRRGESRIYKPIFGKTPEEIYQEYATQQVNKRTTSRVNNPDLFVDELNTSPNDNIQSRTQEISKFKNEMDDAQRAAAVFNYILSQSAKFEGEAAERANTLAGRVDKIRAAFDNAQVNIGTFITEIRPVASILEAISEKAGALDFLRGPSLGRSGPGGGITQFDLQKYAIERTSGARYNLLQNINELAGPALIGGGITAGLGLLGRGTAVRETRLKVYSENFDRLAKEFDGNLVAAQNEAIRVAKDAKPGLVRSVGTGVRRLTIGVSDAVLGPTGYSVSGIGADRKPPIFYGNVGPVQGAQGPYTPLLTARDKAIMQGLTTGAGSAGGLLGGGIGGTIGYLIAEKMQVGPIAATTLTIGGAIIGNAAGSAIGTAIGASFAGYIASAGGVTGLLTSGLGTLAGYLGAGATAGTVGLTAGAGLLAGGGIGAAINYLNPYDALSREQLTLDRSREYGIAASRAEREYQGAEREGRLRYRDLDTSSPTFGQLVTPDEAKRRGLLKATPGQILGITNPLTRQEILPVNSPDLKLDTIEKVQAKRIEIESKITGEFQDQQQAQEEMVRLQSKGVDLTGDDKKANDDRIAQIQQQIDLFRDLNKVREAEDIKRQYGTEGLLLGPEFRKVQDEARANFERSNQARKEQEQRDRQETINQQSNALSKLRDTAEGSFRLVGDTAKLLAGDENPYVQVLSEQITLGERMARTWGHLGEKVVEYQTKLEQLGLNRQLNALQYQTYTSASNLQGQINQGELDRQQPGLNTREKLYLDVQSAIVDRAVEIPKLWAQAAEILGRPVSQIRQLQGTIRELQVGLGIGARPINEQGRIQGFSAGPQTTQFVDPTTGQLSIQTLDAGHRNDYKQYAESQAFFNNLSPEAQKETRKLYAENALQVFSQYTPQQIRRAGLTGAYVQALRIKAGGLDQNIADARKRAELQAQSDDNLRNQLAADESFRQEQIRKGFDPIDVGREADRLTLSRFQGIPDKDLTAQQFEQKQQALRREVERTVSKEDEAKQAVQQGLDYQDAILETIDDIRTAIVGGNLSMLIQVQNDTQARIDQGLLQEANSGRYNVNLDQGATKTSPYQRMQERYGKGGIKRGKGGF